MQNVVYRLAEGRLAIGWEQEGLLDFEGTQRCIRRGLAGANYTCRMEREKIKDEVVLKVSSD